MYKLVAIDLDGTLLDDKDEIGVENLKAIKKAIDKGVKVALCSSRIYLATKCYSELLSKDQPVIVSNGALIRIGRENIFNSYLQTEDLLEIFEIIGEDKENIRFSFGHINPLEKFLFTNNENTKKYLQMHYNKLVPLEFQIKAKVIKDPAEYIGRNHIQANKISFVGENPITLETIKNRLEELNKYEITSSESTNIEITQKDIHKGSALKKLLKYYGYKREESIAIGNGQNDLSMIKKAGVGVAMKNSSTLLREHADYITKKDNNHNGVAEVFEKYGL